MSMLRRAPWREILLVTAVFASALIWMFTASAHAPSRELANPIVPLPAPPLGIDGTLTDLVLRTRFRAAQKAGDDHHEPSHSCLSRSRRGHRSRGGGDDLRVQPLGEA